ncbi:hypothetical protein TUM17576_46950 [Enterobacter hormaechei]|nr:ead/Ea22-like family protein [Enterobacter hormaechei]GJL37875.1 hypothetical protein TUM17576_46950 [Enterobacter hormaechei]
MKPSCEELEARVSELSKALDISLSVQRDLAKRMGEMLLQIKRAESAIGSLGWMSIDTAISLELSKLNKQISDLQGQVRALTEQRDALVAEMSHLWGFCKNAAFDADYEAELGMERGGFTDALNDIRTPAHDAAIAALRAEGAHFVANRMLAAWEDGFIEDTANNAADIARMILTSTEFMADAPAGDFDRSFADEMLKAITDQIRSQSDQIKGDK